MHPMFVVRSMDMSSLNGFDFEFTTGTPLLCFKDDCTIEEINHLFKCKNEGQSLANRKSVATQSTSIVDKEFKFLIQAL